MKLLSTLAISSYSISLSFLTIASPAHAVSESETNNSFATTKLLPSGVNSVDGQLENESVDFYTFSNFDAGNLFTVEVNSQSFDPLIGRLNDFGKIIEINDDQSDNNVLPILTGEIPASGNLNLALSGLRDINLTGNHFESGSYTLSLKTFVLPSSPNNTTLVNGGFETGNFTGWSTLGSTSIETATFGSDPTDATSQALLSTGGATFDDSITEKFLGLEAGSLNNLSKGQVTKGSTIQQIFTAKAGDILSLDYNFMSNEVLPPITFSDFSFVSISSSSDSSINSLLELADVSDATSTTSLTEFFEETGFQTFSFKLPTTGTYTLGIGIINVGDIAFDSGLLIDNVKVTSVPEPSFGLLKFSALVLLVFWKKFLDNLLH
ncbi:hypothetical protein GNF10_15400 [Nostoc sp. UCD121]|uniref:hypothetical protein n=1 Tax=unclassified Nostoc TaxID=2593658 RepID=UPI0016233DB8|nr:MULTISPECIES: hypothetical protein [unclassified Nostoc]MBC1222983.1 hypothetical protein [Nostoc sp. UCD120]MBC1277303.1 hypothetical protein [Nostoc sp. UCD121]MBC1294033.1 hypothetical protein [Nostoc sp. UCD122]